MLTLIITSLLANIFHGGASGRTLVGLVDKVVQVKVTTPSDDSSTDADSDDDDTDADTEVIPPVPPVPPVPPRAPLPPIPPKPTKFYFNFKSDGRDLPKFTEKA